jgi:tetratricopeptide (TPR) repeat protein
MMADPTNPERSFEFAQAAVAIGDLRGAIAALERILQINPGLANIQLELGVLYLRVGQTDLAASYLRGALLAPDVPDPVRDRAQAMLARAERGRQKHFLTGSIYAGGRYDTNANAGPAFRQVRVGGVDRLLNESATGRKDFSAEFAASLNYTYALESQAGHEIEANFLSYNRRYDKSSEINLSSVGLDLGPRLYLGGIPESTFSVRPFVSASYLWLDDDSYLRQLGGGVNLRQFFETVSFVEVTLEASDQKFYDSASRPTSSNRSGPFVDLRGRVSYQWRARTRLFAGAGFARRDSDQKFEAFNEGGILLGVTQVYAPPFGLTSYPWSSTLSAGVLRTVYDEADPAIDPNQKRKDTRANIVLSNDVRMTRSLTLVVSVQYTDNDSSLPNFEYDNTGVGVGLAWSF